MNKAKNGNADSVPIHESHEEHPNPSYHKTTAIYNRDFMSARIIVVLREIN